METFLPGTVLGFREGLEAFLLLAILLRALDRGGRRFGRTALALGGALGIGASVALGAGLAAAEKAFGDAEAYAAGWALAANLLALGLITLFLVWMVRQGGDLGNDAKRLVAAAPSPLAILVLAFFLVGREGAEVALFGFAGEFPALAIAVGAALSLGLAILIGASLIRVDLRTLFRWTLVYLILQAGYLAGAGMHEALSLLGATGALPAGSALLAKAFDLSGTVLDRESGVVGIALNILVGWNSDPEWPSLVFQASYAAALLLLWRRSLRRIRKA